MRFGEPHPYPERGSHTDGASRGNKERVIVYNIPYHIISYHKKQPGKFLSAGNKKRLTSRENKTCF
jgi:hypothetical protein